ncbi:hypothetical protein GCM10010515_59780 [Streptomyces fructofermentans]|uniref:Uncharacterized protein n=1 Tax=Streptomyces fructofermentans TaxID=152141 RepID=A0A918NNU7_9ACTN|nr:hypothetical protein GCM10010515_59780 [Streptomyces fructofermentans]
MQPFILDGTGSAGIERRVKALGATALAPARPTYRATLPAPATARLRIAFSGGRFRGSPTI